MLILDCAGCKMNIEEKKKELLEIYEKNKIELEKTNKAIVLLKENMLRIEGALQILQELESIEE